MQILPSTAADRNIGIADIHEAEQNVHAGVKYLRFIRDRYFTEPDIAPLDQVLFSFAAYNAGPANIARARKKAQAMGLDRNRWFGHVEQAMLLLSQNEYASQARYGYVHGQEPVDYVRAIRERYYAYIRLGEATLALGSDRALDDTSVRSSDS